MSKYGLRTRDELLSMAECVAQVGEAVAVTLEAGSGGSFAPAVGLRSITNPCRCHLEAAIFLLALMLSDSGNDADELRREIPEVVAAVACSPAA